MIRRLPPPFVRHAVSSRQTCARAFAEHIRAARVHAGPPVAEITPEAALIVAEWTEIEAGRMSDTWEQILLLARALGFGPLLAAVFRALVSRCPGELILFGPGSWRQVLITG